MPSPAAEARTMLAGLGRMHEDELHNLCRLAGLKLGPGRPAVEYQEALLNWMADRVCPGATTPPEVERAAVQWLADRGGVDYPRDEPVAQLERRAWVRISEDAARNLIPVWKIASSMAALGPPTALPHEVELLEKAAARLFPSEAARRQMQSEWDDLCARPAIHAKDLIERIRPELQQVSTQRELLTPTLVLTLVVALADSKYEMEEARHFEAIARGLGLADKTLEEMQDQVSRRFWDERRELNIEALGDLQASLIAAHRTLERSGAIRTLAGEAEHGLVTALHGSVFKDGDFKRGVNAWNRTPFLWPVGFAVGIWLYLKRRLRPKDHRALSAILYQAYTREQAPANSQ